MYGLVMCGRGRKGCAFVELDGFFKLSGEFAVLGGSAGGPRILEEAREVDGLENMDFLWIHENV